MRTENEMLDLILSVARSDDRIRAVAMGGSRANPMIPKDDYQDYDVMYYVTDIAPFFNNPAWAKEKFGKPLILQMSEAMRGAVGDGNFNYQMIFPDGVRIDLNLFFQPYTHDDEPAVILLDKDDGKGMVRFSPTTSDTVWHVKPPTELDFYSCCNDFWWCQNNVAKGIARDELSYAMFMLNDVVRSELRDMVSWYIGVKTDFSLSAGKLGKYYKRYLPPELYERYNATYLYDGTYASLWTAMQTMGGLFHDLALEVAASRGFAYRQNEEDGMREYIKMVRKDSSLRSE